MPLYEVTYKIKHIRLFNVPEKHYIESVLNEASDVEIINIVEVISDDQA